MIILWSTSLIIKLKVRVKLIFKEGFYLIKSRKVSRVETWCLWDSKFSSLSSLVIRPGLIVRTSEIPRITARNVVDIKKLRAWKPMRFKLETSMLAKPKRNLLLFTTTKHKVQYFSKHSVECFLFWRISNLNFHNYNFTDKVY